MCESDLDCGASYFCNAFRMRCEPIPGTVPLGSVCTNDLQCRAGLLCQSGKCADLMEETGAITTHRLGVVEYILLLGIIIAAIAMLVPLALVCLPRHWTARIRHWLGMKDPVQQQQQHQDFYLEQSPGALVYSVPMVPFEQQQRFSQNVVSGNAQTPPNSPASQPEYDPRMDDDNEPLPAYEQPPPKYDDVVPPSSRQ